jgi:outer membrane protein insertion porin family
VTIAGAKQLKVKSVEFEGIRVFNKDRLYRVMISRPSAFLSPSYFYAQVFEDDLQDLELFYHQNGYLEAKVLALTTVEGVSIFGNQVFSDSELRPHIVVEVEGALNQKNIESTTINLLTLYAKHGYLEASITPDIRVNEETHRAIIDYIIEEKIKFSIADIEIVGLEKTKTSVVLRELSFNSGESVNYALLLESQRKLYLTGLFESVFIHPKAAASGDASKKDILIELRENLSGEFNVAVGFGSVEKLRGRIELLTSNLRGTARKIGIAAKASFTNLMLEASFSEPWTFGSRWISDIVGYVEQLNEPGYELNRLGVRYSLGRSFWDKSRVTFTYRHENIFYKKVVVMAMLPEEENKIRSFKLSYIYDSRDNLFTPIRGNYLEVTNEWAGLLLKGSSSFSRISLRAKSFYPWEQFMVLASALEIGIIKKLNSSQEIPLNERFYAGGQNSIRGFEYRKVGPLDANRWPVGGNLKIVWNLIELRKRIYKIWGAVVFIDIGNVWSDVKSFRIKDLRTGIGLGLRADTPIGLISLDYGINPAPLSGEDRGRLYFNMGHSF